MFSRRGTLREFQKRRFTANGGSSAVVVRTDECEYFDLWFFR